MIYTIFHISKLTKSKHKLLYAPISLCMRLRYCRSLQEKSIETVDRFVCVFVSGKPVKRFSPADEPVTLEEDIEALFA